METVVKTQDEKCVKLKKHFLEMKEGVQDALSKVEFLSKFRTKDDLVVMDYPAGFPFSTLKIICHALENAGKFNEFVELRIPAGKNHTFVLVRNSSPSYYEMEEKQKNTGSLLSNQITDLGQFLIAETFGNLALEGAHFHLYKMKD